MKKDEAKNQESLDQEVYEMLQKGHPDAANRLVETFGERIYGLGLRILNSEADAHEVVQETMLNIWRKWPTFQGKSKFSSWVYRIAANQAYMLLRRNRKQKGNISLDERRAGTTSGEYLLNRTLSIALKGQPVPPDQILQRQELQTAILRAVDHLSPTYRMAYMLKDIEGLSLKDIAEVIGLSEAAVKSRVHRARLLIRDKISRYLKN